MATARLVMRLCEYMNRLVCTATVGKLSMKDDKCYNYVNAVIMTAIYVYTYAYTDMHIITIRLHVSRLYNIQCESNYLIMQYVYIYTLILIRT